VVLLVLALSDNLTNKKEFHRVYVRLRKSARKLIFLEQCKDGEMLIGIGGLNLLEYRVSLQSIALTVPCCFIIPGRNCMPVTLTGTTWQWSVQALLEGKLRHAWAEYWGRSRAVFFSCMSVVLFCTESHGQGRLARDASAGSTCMGAVGAIGGGGNDKGLVPRGGDEEQDA
jgi:hypothetical protein